VETYDKKLYVSVPESRNCLVFGSQLGILDVSSWPDTQFFMQNPKLRSELSNSFTLRRTNLKKTYESLHFL